MAKHQAIKMIMIDQLPKAAITDNITYGEKTTTAVLLACGRRSYFKLDNPITFLDTKNVAAYIVPLVFTSAATS